MWVGFEDGKWRVTGFGGHEVVGRNLALLQQQYADWSDTIMLSSADEVGHHLALVNDICWSVFDC